MLNGLNSLEINNRFILVHDVLKINNFLMQLSILFIKIGIDLIVDERLIELNYLNFLDLFFHISSVLFKFDSLLCLFYLILSNRFQSILNSVKQLGVFVNIIANQRLLPEEPNSQSIIFFNLKFSKNMLIDLGQKGLSRLGNGMITFTELMHDFDKLIWLDYFFFIA